VLHYYAAIILKWHYAVSMHVSGNCSMWNSALNCRGYSTAPGQ